jgi:hypothetical protein
MAVNSSSSYAIVYPDVNYSENQWLERDHSNLYCLLIKDYRGVYVEECVEGLLLELTENVGEFRRWGKFCAFSAKKVGVLREGCKVFDSKADETGLEYCDDGKGGYKYTLTII